MAQLITLINLTRQNNIFRLHIRYLFKLFVLLRHLDQLGLLKLALINGTHHSIQLTFFNFAGFNAFYRLKLISRPSRAYFISVVGLALLTRRLGTTLLFINTPRGLLTQNEALQQRSGGQLICLLLN